MKNIYLTHKRQELYKMISVKPLAIKGQGDYAVGLYAVLPEFRGVVGRQFVKLKVSEVEEIINNANVYEG